MHQALGIPEILLDIFHHCCPLDLSKDSEHRREVRIPQADLAALARTCRIFKEPALDLLWEVLIDLSPIVRCLPDASLRASGKRDMFSFRSRLTSDDWDIIRSYTRRIRFIHHFTEGLDRKAIRILSTPPTAEPLFPNLRILHYDHADRYTPLLHLPLPSLVSLSVKCSFSQLANHGSMPFLKLLVCPDIRMLSIHVVRTCETMFKGMDSSDICQWRNLQSVVCPQLTLDVNALIHLSRMPALITLHIALCDTSLALNSTLSFANLLDLMLNSDSLSSVSQLLSHSRLPVITNLKAHIHRRPSRRDLSFFFSSLGTSTTGRTVETFSLTQSLPMDINRPLDPLGLEDLRPCLAFCNLRHMEFDIECHVRLTDADVLAMTSAWPELQHLLINVHFSWGCDSRGRVTSDGLVFQRVILHCPPIIHR